eukprot:SAG11_NODE_1551_length_4697_cov_10.474554_4_plen_77_part_00
MPRANQAPAARLPLMMWSMRMLRVHSCARPPSPSKNRVGEIAWNFTHRRCLRPQNSQCPEKIGGNAVHRVVVKQTA